MPKFGPRWRVGFKRKRKGKTDYRQRLRLLRSGKSRLVARVSLKHITAQVIRATPGGDSTLASANSKEIEKLGWKGHTSNLPAAYLVGLMCGYRALKLGIKECVLDLGMHSPTSQAKVFGALKGALDAGLKIPADEGMLPSQERIRGEHVASYATDLKADEHLHRAKFSLYLKRGLEPEKLPVHFDQIREKIVAQHGG